MTVREMPHAHTCLNLQGGIIDPTETDCVVGLLRHTLLFLESRLD
jgi:hypothetical protein